MVGSKFTKLVEKHSEELSRELVLKLQSSSRTKSFHDIPMEELKLDVDVLYRNLGDWLLYRTEADVKARYGDIGRRRAQQQIAPEQLVWAFMLAREHVITFLHRESLGDGALALFSELEFVLTLTQFFDRAIYYALEAQSAVRQQVAA